MSISTIFFLYFCLFILLLSSLLLITIYVYSLSYTGGYIHIMLKLLLCILYKRYIIILVAFASMHHQLLLHTKKNIPLPSPHAIGNQRFFFVEGAAEKIK